MNDKQQRFARLLESMGLEHDRCFAGGEIKYLQVTNSQKTWVFHLVFPEVLRIEDYLRLEAAFQKHYLIEGIEEVSIKIEYLEREVPNKLLEAYYQYFLASCSQEQARYTALKAFSAHYEGNRINFYVGSEDEVEMVEELLERVKTQFRKYHLEQVAVEVKYSPFETPITKVIEEQIKESAKEAIQAQEVYDRLLEGQKPQNNNKEKVFKKRKLSAEINGQVTPLSKVPASEVQIIEYQQKFGNKNFVVSGEVIAAEIKNAKEFKIYEATIFDGSDSLIIKSFINTNNYLDEDFYLTYAKVGDKVRVFGYLEYDRFSKDVVLRIKDIIGLGQAVAEKKTDNASRKRVELHAHTKMSTLDGVMDIEEYVRAALEYGHSAIAVTDHYNLQSLPELNSLTAKTDLKPIFGVEGALIDEDGFKIALTDADIDLDTATYVVYDLETTGLSSNYHEIIEVAAVKVHKGTFVEEFSTYVKPKREIPANITELTGITNDDVRDAPPVEDVMVRFKKFIDGCILVAHNATFDNSHLYRNLRDLKLFDGEFPSIDTMQLARVRYGNKLKTFNLKALTKYFDVELTQHHRAIYDAKATAEVFLRMLTDLKESKIFNYNQINSTINPEEAFSLSHPTHIVLLAKNPTGLKNLNKIVTDSHTVHFSKEPRIMKSFLEAHREGLLIGSSCCNGDVFDRAFRESYEKLLQTVEFYDYLEIQPPAHYLHLFDSGDEVFEMECIEDTLQRIIRAGRDKGKIVVATGDVHILNREDLRFREIFINAPQVGGGVHKLFNMKNIATQHFMNTEEMLGEFHFLGPDLAEELVVTNSNKIAAMIERFPLFPEKLYAPSDDFLKDRGVPSFKQAVIDLTYSKARETYGEELPAYLAFRLKKELDSIINNNYASIYYISHLLVEHSREAGYIVGSRGSVGSSLVAFFMGITEVNGLAPHYYCPKCHFSAFKLTKEEKGLYPPTPEALKLDNVLQGVGTGYDLPDQKCPHCGAELAKDGCDIPFETFLGFKGDKVPDIDLNFSGEYQSQAHEFCRELFGVDNAFRAGTISTIADKSAFGYVKGYLERKGIEARNCEIARLANKITGVKRSTGQHPGGIVVIPKEIEYTDIIPVQYPADDTTAAWRTTHYDYHKFEANLLKLDILGHDDPTMIRHLMDFVEKEPEQFPFRTVEEIPLSDPKVLAIFSGLSSLGVESSQVHEVVGTTGIPEFGTTLSKDMLREIRPTSVNELIKISGLSHGTDVWSGNARDYMLGLRKDVGPIPFKDLIGCRDDIMVYLMSKDIPASDAFKIMESVRKGKGISPEQEKEMLSYKIPKWYIDSCKMIKYMFPKAHATAYVIMALRIAWFKVHRPLYYYAAYFSRRANAFDVVCLVGGYQAINLKIKELDEKIAAKTASNKELDLYNCLLLALEMTARGYTFQQMNIFKSDWRDFLIEGRSLIIPFKAMDSLGEATAKSITDAREEMMFSSKKDILRRTKVNSTLYERLDQLDVFSGLPDEDQIGLF
jgi:DNA polymerase-3 subunit alpha (Gram-positive type)